jgi:hypothetical protein
MLKRILLFAFAPLLLLVAASSDMTITVAQLRQFIESAVKMKQPDKQVADYLKSVKLKEKLDDKTIEELQGEGAGPKTVAALKLMGERTATMAAPPPPAAVVKAVPIPPPDSIEQGKILNAVREYAMNYTKQLPNYLCLQVTRRYVDTTASQSWRSTDVITIRLSYNEGHEDYKVVTVNSAPVTDTSMEKLGGTVSQGEFASMMLDIFKSESQARFDWDHWATLRGKRCYVFSYDIDQVNSRYHIVADKTEEYVPAYRGLIYVDKDTNFVMRIVHTPYDLPGKFPIQDVKTVLDYDYTKVGDNEYLLPMQSVVTSKSNRYLTKNVNEFRMYRKFGTESTIKFDSDPGPLPEDKTKEKPQKP